MKPSGEQIRGRRVNPEGHLAVWETRDSALRGMGVVKSAYETVGTLRQCQAAIKVSANWALRTGLVTHAPQF
jgi:hypothetical protein